VHGLAGVPARQLHQLIDGVFELIVAERRAFDG